MISGPRDLAAKLLILFLILQDAALGVVAIPMIVMDLAHDTWPGELYNSVITSEFRTDLLFYYIIYPLLGVISLSTFWNKAFRRSRSLIFLLCGLGLFFTIILYIGLVVTDTQKELWQLASLETINSHDKFTALTTAFCIENGAAPIAVFAFAVGTEPVREKIAQAINYFKTR